MPTSLKHLSENIRSGRIAESGMSMLELLIAMAILAVGMTGAMGMILAGVQSDARNKNDTSAVVLDQELLETFATYKNYPLSGQIPVNDCSTGATSQKLAAATGTTAGAGAAVITSGNNTGDIDWTQAAPALATSTVPGYAMDYQTCNGDIYEVRWNITKINANNNVSQLSHLTVSSRQIAAGGSNQAILFAIPVSVHTLIEDFQ
jgi:prepilin-type N-terminal cleavage/methylation domain-containing protein